MDVSKPWRDNIEMIDAARSGDEMALLALLNAAQPDIRRYAVRSCKTTDDVNDAVQETLWLLYRRIGTVRTLTSVSAWLVTVVRRECARLSRRMFGNRSDVADMEDSLLLSRRPESELRIDLTRAIQSLPAHYREIILLRDIEEMTIDEIAVVLELSRESVKGRLHRARGLIREYLRS